MSDSPAATSPATAERRAVRGPLARELISAYRASWTVWGIVALGCVLRLLQLAANRSLSGDESFLALNVADNPWHHLLHRLDFNQVAPTLFLLAQKTSVTILGRSEVALRLIPAVAGIAAMVLFPLLARRLLDRDAVPLAVLLFALCDPLVAWGATDKQYAVDVFATVAVLLLAARARAEWTPRSVTALALGGSVAVLLSFPVSVVLAGAGSTLAVLMALRRAWSRVAVVGGVSALWLAVFAIEYRLAATGIHALQTSLGGTAGGGSSGGGSFATDAQSAFRYVTGIPIFLRFGERDAGRVAEVFVAVLWLVGVAHLARRRPVSASLLVLPLAFALGAVLVDAYPLLPRAMLYTTVLLWLPAAQGGVLLVRRARTPELQVAAATAVGAVALLLLVPAAGHAVRPRATQEMRPALERLAGEVRPGDTVYVLYSAQYGLRWYLECGCTDAAVARATADGLIPLVRAAEGPDQWAPALASSPPRFLVAAFRGHDPSPYVADLRALRGRRRVWVLLANVPTDFRHVVLDALGGMGSAISSYRANGDESAAALYLYDLGARP